MYIVELAPSIYIAPWEGDPGRTVLKENAKIFAIKKDAEKALKKALKQRFFKSPRIIKVYVYEKKENLGIDKKIITNCFNMITEDDIYEAQGKALKLFKKWNDATGCFEENTEYYYEIESLLINALWCGLQMAINKKIKIKDGEVVKTI